MIIRIVGYALPGLRCGPHENVHVALQRKSEPDQAVPADAAEVRFEAEAEVFSAGDSFDFRGPHIHGKSGERFIYITWSEAAPDGSFTMFSRTKLRLDAVPAETIAAALKGGVLAATLPLTDARGSLVTGSVRSPASEWRACEA